ncbi:uncharacterized protein LOC119606216 [Lucilia sericata]|uniref:uncharacterized protein LOC119606216 n=1 Tax=Lucilia sericata TaxID=13632 RepID=UPI0018A8475E|nr:uncharacterized protein LOC119606216 [Lucilia sericata]XP_037815571.1 uncharacterized protein LOC119606216 [Lucilia sericata]XP_037815572.1 uncharacterized protein LOC119606216 [Lucilia sericata]
MFQPETEDMLPRMAPKPSAAVPNGEGIIRPQVPEISILFGQQESNVLPQQNVNGGIQQQQFKTNNPQPSYAAWKKQMLPKVNYTPSAVNMAEVQLSDRGNNNNMMPDYNSPRANLYPLRTATAPVANMAPNVAANDFAQSNPLTYRRSLEGCNNNMMYQQQMPHLPQTMSSQSPLQSIKPLSNPINHLPSRDVLTICAGTQTDASLDSSNNYQHNLQSGPWSNLASKQDVDEMRLILEGMQQEQQRMIKMLETLLFNPAAQFAIKPQSRDMGVQADCVENDNQPFTNGDALTNNQAEFDIPQQAVAKNKFLQHLKPSPSNILQTPKGKPMAQSTTYRPNSPQTLRFQTEQNHEVASAPTYQQVSSKPPPSLHKSASDTSLAMNELALKYLPNEKLAELLNELNMECPTGQVNNYPLPSTPVRQSGDKFEKGPSDISNASYKYLKKYRLLPEDHVEDEENVIVNQDRGVQGEILVNVNENQAYNSPQQQYNNIRNTPLNQRQTPTNKCSPYAGRLPLSPLTRGAATPPLSSAAIQAQHLVNLDNIKQQPKFL